MFYTNDQITKAIESLLMTSGYQSWNVISVVDESAKYCYKTFDGTIGAVDKGFIHDRIPCKFSA
jgi:hypothetical protein